MESPADAVPNRLGEFAILGVLGQGGTGVVYAARRGEQAVALKVLREDQVPTGKERQRFLDEAQHMAKLRHPGIVKVFGAGELEDGRPYLAMEQLEGSNLAEAIASGTLDRERALDLFDQLAAAVQAMHDEGLIHRDLKPENVMLVDGGKRAVLLDFGIAKPADAPPSTTTQAGLQRGTPAYMAPERFFGARATMCSDVYELGVILYVMLCGRLPWDNPLDAKARLDPQGPSAHGVQVPDIVERTLMQALSSNEDDRPASAKSFARAIKGAAWSTAATVLAAPSAVTAAPTEKTRSLVGAYVAAATVVIAGAIGLTLWLVQEPGSAGAEEQAKVAKRTEAKRKRPPKKIVAETPTVIAPAADAAAPAAPDAAPVAETAPEPEPRKPKPKPKTAGTRLPECRKILKLYCNAEFKKTEGGMSGALCRQMTKNVTDWEAMPPDARAEMGNSCRQMYPDLKAAVDERLRQYRAGTGPVKPD